MEKAESGRTPWKRSRGTDDCARYERPNGRARVTNRVGEYFDSVANSLDLQSQFSSDPEFRSALMTEVDVNANDRILDVGTGTGNCALYFMQRSPNVIGVDISSHMLAIARGKGVECVCADASALPFAQHSFDLVVCRQLFYYFDCVLLARVLGELRRVTKPTGKLFITQNVPFARGDRDFLTSLMCVEGIDLHYQTVEELSSILRETGFHLTRQGEIVHPVGEALTAFCSLRRLSVEEGGSRLIELEKAAPAVYQMRLSENQVDYRRRYVWVHASPE